MEVKREASVTVDAGGLEANPACAVMTADCPPEAECRLQVRACRVAHEAVGAVSRYLYGCNTCNASWLVDFPQAQPVFDRRGVAEPPVPRVEQIRTG